MVFDTKYDFLMRPDDFFDWPQIGETTSQNRTNLSGVSFFTVFSQFFPYDLLFIVFQNENGQSLSVGSVKV